MSSTPGEVLALADRLIVNLDGQPIDEVVLRCATSRAYYAALHAADGALPDDIAPTYSERKGKSSHQAVIDAMVLWGRSHRPGRMDAIEVARNLPKLRHFRKHADYKLDEDFVVEDAQTALKVAKRSVESANRAALKAADKQA